MNNICETCNGSGRDKLSRLARIAKVTELEITKAAIRGQIPGIHEVNAEDGTFQCGVCFGKGRTSFDLIGDQSHKEIKP